MAKHPHTGFKTTKYNLYNLCHEHLKIHNGVVPENKLFHTTAITTTTTITTTNATSTVTFQPLSNTLSRLSYNTVTTLSLAC